MTPLERILDEASNHIIDMIASAYITVEGLAKWDKLTDEQKHDVVMILAKDFNNAIDRL